MSVCACVWGVVRNKEWRDQEKKEMWVGIRVQSGWGAWTRERCIFKYS